MVDPYLPPTSEVHNEPEITRPAWIAISLALGWSALQAAIPPVSLFMAGLVHFFLLVFFFGVLCVLARPTARAAAVAAALYFGVLWLATELPTKPMDRQVELGVLRFQVCELPSMLKKNGVEARLYPDSDKIDSWVTLEKSRVSLSQLEKTMYKQTGLAFARQPHCVYASSASFLWGDPFDSLAIVSHRIPG